MQRRIPPHQTVKGMFVCGFGGSWFRHPFWRGQFLIQSAEDVAKVHNSGVPYVVIDDERGVGPAGTAPPPPALADRGRPHAMPSRPAFALPEARRVPSPVDYGAGQRESERRAVNALVKRSKKIVRGVFDDARLGRAIRVADVAPIVDDIAAQIARSPHAMLGITQLKNKDEYTYLHSVAVCTLMVNMARHMGLDEAAVRDLGLAGLLHDIGKMGIPEPILNKAGRLTDEEFLLVRGHPEHGYMLLSDAPDISEMALDVCRHHHEKIDGSGYPFGLTGDGISLAARLGAICDIYDALTSDRIYKDAWTAPQAVAAMWSWEGHLDRELLFTFMQSIGVFPIGMLVRLRSNRLAIVLANNRRSSRTQVMAFHSARERCPLPHEIVVIHDDLSGDQIMSPELPDDWGFGDWGTLQGQILGDHAPALAE